jgi:hypothetical protein
MAYVVGLAGGFASAEIPFGRDRPKKKILEELGRPSNLPLSDRSRKSCT